MTTARPPIPACVLAAVLLGAGCRGEPPGAAFEPPPAPGTRRLSPPASDARDPAAPPHSESETWAVALELPQALQAGAPARAVVRVVARGGMHVNEEYPSSFRPSPGLRASFDRDRVPLADVARRVPCAVGAPAACEVAFSLPFQPSAPGEVHVSGTLAFSVCSEERCLIEKVPLAAKSVAR